MNKIFAILVLCVACASCFKLKNLCSSDTFTYNGILVNAFYTFQDNFTFGPFSRYLINDTIECDENEFTNKTNIQEVLRAKDAYNRTFTELFTKDLKRFSRNSSVKIRRILRKEDEIVRFGWLPLLKLKRVETQSKCLDIFEEKALAGIELLLALKRFVQINGYPTPLPDDFKPSIHEVVKDLGDVMGKFKKVANENQTFAFESESASDVYRFRKIVFLYDFKFFTERAFQVNLEESGPNTMGMIVYEQHMPFNNKLYTDHGCVPAENLPLFYKSKGNDQDD